MPLFPSLVAIFLGLVWAQAEPAPFSSVPEPAGDPGPGPIPVGLGGGPAPASAIGAAFGVQARLAPASRELPPVLGVAVGLTASRRYFLTDAGFELCADLDFGYARHTETVASSRPNTDGQEVAFQGQRIISEGSFALLQTLAWTSGRWRPWIGIGGGLTLGYLSTEELALRPGESTALRPFVRGAAGLDAQLRPDLWLGGRVDFSGTTTTPTFTPAASTPITVFGSFARFAAVVSTRF